MPDDNLNRLLRTACYAVIITFHLYQKNFSVKQAHVFIKLFQYVQRLKNFTQFACLSIREAPKDVVEHLLTEIVGFPVVAQLDVNNTLLCSNSFLERFDVRQPVWVLAKHGLNRWRWVCVVPAPLKEMGNTCVATPVLLHNFAQEKMLRGGYLEVTIYPGISRSLEKSYAAEVRIAEVSRTSESGSKTAVLQQFFQIARYVQPDDVIVTPNPAGNARDLTFVITDVVPGDSVVSKRNFGYFAHCEKTTLYQVADQQRRLPPEVYKSTLHARKELKPSCLGDVQQMMIPLQPHGLGPHCEQMLKLFVPFLKAKLYYEKNEERNLPGSPHILISGAPGSGKRTAAKSVALALGTQFHEASAASLMGESPKATEARISYFFQNAEQIAPVLVYLTDIEAIGQPRDGHSEDFRIVRFFAERARLTSRCKDPVFLVGSCRDEGAVRADLFSVFLHAIRIEVPTADDRAEMIRWLLHEKNLVLDATWTIEKVARQTPSFLWGDLNALISVAARETLVMDRSSAVLTSRALQKSLDQVREWQSESIGAPRVPEVRWEDIGGLEHAIKEILDTVQLPLQFPELVASGLKRSGILLYGPPGTGKTLLAKAVATECSLHFLSVKGPELLNMYVGQSEENVRNVFEKARQASPCLIFFDELDSLAPNRGRSGDSGGVMDRVVSQLLAELDGINKSATVFVIGATNRPDLVDPALLRPGRFDKLVYLGVSTDKKNQAAILRAVTRKFPLDSEVSMDDIADHLPENLTGADLYSLCAGAMLNSFSRAIRSLEAGDELTEQDEMVCSEDFHSAVDALVPSVSAKDLAGYQQLHQKLSHQKSKGALPKTQQES